MPAPPLSTTTKTTKKTTFLRAPLVTLHDNMGINDEHLAPGEGMVNWANVRDIIDASSYEGSYTLESDSAVIPAGRTPLEHLLLHYKGAKAMLFP